MRIHWLLNSANFLLSSIIKLGKFDQDICRDIDIPSLVIAVDPLAAIQKLRQLLLRHIMIFP